VLRAVPDSDLLLGAITDQGLQTSLIERFAAQGIAAERLIFHPRMPLLDYLALHHQVDLIVDTFPYSGATTSAHAIWMGVPVLSLVGETMTSRQTATILYPTGLEEFVAHTPEQFVTQAVYWATHPQQLGDLRMILRERITNSPLMNVAPIARALEKALRIIWQRWCDGLAPASIDVVG
jgi:predicted O-linked N-acetylglucosamine transferase (SPINDLY family)